MATITVWDEINFGGYATEFRDSVPNLSAENIVMEDRHGPGQFFEHAGYGGVATKVYGPGACLNCAHAGFSNKWISSIRKISD
jgi:hypothetical protein